MSTLMTNAVRSAMDSGASICYKLVRVCRGSKAVREFYQCPLCLVELPEVSDVRSHHEQVHPDIPYDSLKLDTVGTEITAEEPHCTMVASKGRVNCPYCPAILSSISHLQRHVVSRHYSRLAAKDVKTGDIKRSTNSNVELLEQDQDGVKKCIACPSTFTSNAGLDRHLSLHKDVICYLCDYCDLTVGRLLDLAKHMLQHSAAEVAAKREEEAARKKTDEQSGTDVTVGATPVSMVYRTGRVCCPYCPSVISSVDHLNTHIVRCHLDRLGTTVTTHDEASESETGIVLNNMDSEFWYKDSNTCIVCTMAFSKKSDLYLHMGDHKDVIFYPCALCDGSFKKLLCLVKHMAVHCVTDRTSGLEGKVDTGECGETNTPVQVDVTSEAGEISEHRGTKRKTSHTIEAENYIVTDKTDQMPKSKGNKRNIAQLTEMKNNKKTKQINHKKRRKKYLNKEDGIEENIMSVRGELTNTPEENSEIKETRIAPVTTNSVNKGCIVMKNELATGINLGDAAGSTNKAATDSNQCPNCEFSCKRKSALKFHMNMVHSHPPGKANTKKEVQPAAAVDHPPSCRKKSGHMALLTTKGKQLVCQVCDQIFRSSASLRNHLKVHDVTTSSVANDSCDTRVDIPASPVDTDTPSSSEAAVEPDMEMEPACSQLDSHLENSGREPGSQVESSKQESGTSEGPRTKRKQRKCKPCPAPMSSHCDQCGKVYGSRQALGYHVSKHHSDNQRAHMCDVCPKSFWRASELRDHRMEVHSTETPFVCDLCGKGYPTWRGFRRHQSGHRDHEAGIVRPSITCHICGFRINSRFGRQLLYTHIHRSHPETVQCSCEICTAVYDEGNTELMDKAKAVCSECNKCFCLKRYANSHMRTVHSKFMSHVCKFCTARFETPKMLSNHVNKDHKLDQQTFQKNLPHNDLTRKDDLSFLQDSLIIYENDVDSFMHMIKTRRSNMPQYLPKLSEANLNAVIKQLRVNNPISETSTLRFKCLLCQKCFAKGRYVNEHIRRSHIRNEDQPYRCKVCGSGFIRITDFQKHSRTHSNYRPYKCRHCKKAFKQLSNLKEHAVIHSYGHSEKCLLCKKTFKLRGTLISHVLNHSKLHPFKCPFCDKAYPDRGQLSRHMKQYLSLKEKDKHMCHICSETFTTYPLLTSHLTSHNPAKPFKCEVCQDSFGSFVQIYFHKAKKDHFTPTDFDGIQEVKDNDSVDVNKASDELSNIEFSSEGLTDECQLDGNLEPDLSDEICQTNSTSFVFNQSNMNSNSEYVIETVGIETEESVLTVPDEILSVAKQLTELSEQTKSQDKSKRQSQKKHEEQFYIENKEHEILLEMLEIDEAKLKTLVKPSQKNDQQKLQPIEDVKNTNSEETQFPETVVLTEIVDYDGNAILETGTVSYNHDALEEMETEVETESTPLFVDSHYLHAITQAMDTTGVTDSVQISIADSQNNDTIVQSDLIEVCIADDQAIGQQIIIANQDGGLGTETITYDCGTQSIIVPTEETVYHVQVLDSVDTPADNYSEPQNVIDLNMLSDQNSYVETVVQNSEHLVEDIEVESEVITTESVSINVKDIQPIDGRFPCPLCSSRTKSRKYLREHIQRHQGESKKTFACEHPGCHKKFFQRTDLRRHLLVHTDTRPHKCDICGKGFRQSGTLQAHRRTHTGDRPFPCPQPGCDNRYVTSTLLKSHIMRAHNDERHFICMFCDRSFKDRHSFLVHIGGKHSGIFSNKENSSNPDNNDTSADSISVKLPVKTNTTYICDQCGIVTSSKSNLEDHVSSHSNIKPFICHVCGETFGTLRLVNNHVAVKHKSNNDGRKTKRSNKTYECPVCKKVFRTHGGYAYHMGSSENCRSLLVLPSVDVPVVRVLI